MAVIDVHQMRFEEDALRKQFGGDYEAYCSTVPRWVDLRSLRALGGRL
jgi:protein-S-isoprenylcysteine O-methyltransferase Ste14